LIRLNKILFYYSSQQIHTGSPRVLLRLIEALDRKAFFPFFLCDKPGPLCHALSNLNVKFIGGNSPSINRSHLGSNFINLLCLRRQLRRNDIALVHFNELGWNSELAVAAWMAHIPVIFHIHNYTEMTRRNINCRIGSAYLFVSNALMRDCNAQQLVGSKAHVIYNPICANHFATAKPMREILGVQPDSPVIGTVAQISRRKNIDAVVSTAVKVLEVRPDAHFFIVGPTGKGEESYELELLERVARLGLEDHVKFLGPVDDPASFFASLDIFFLPTKYEPFGLVIAEAMSAKVPVVTTNVGGIPEIIPDNSYGIKCDPQSEDFHTHILALLQNPSRRKSITDNAYKRVSALFSDAVFSSRIMSLYSSLIQ
jgi:glycosyltransferase involved in cell wall biosynthesis